LKKDPVSLAEIRGELDKLVDEDQKAKDEAGNESLQTGMTDRLTIAVVQELAMLEPAELDGVIAAGLKAINVPNVPDGNHATITDTVKKVLPPRAVTLAEVEAALKDALGASEHKDKVEGALRPPPGPPGIEFADSNWEDHQSDNEILFSMVVSPFSGELEMWHVNADGSDPRPMDQEKWVTTNWMIPNPNKAGQAGPLI
jgi:hypothetical protein